MAYFHKTINNASKIFLLFCLCVLSINFYINTQEPINNHLTTSVIIPCYWRHFQFIEDLLDALIHQTVLPSEVVISLSEVDKVDPIALQQVETKPYPFPVKIIKHKEKFFAGANRNSACENASGDIFILNDADDLPHVQRIEIIRYVFENSDAQMVMHRFATSNFNITNSYDLSNIHWKPLLTQPCLWFHPAKAFVDEKLHHGNNAIRSECFKKVTWPDNIARGQDCAFCQYFFDSIGNIYMLDQSLILYRQRFSSSILKD